MLAGLQALQARYAFELTVVDIDTDAALYIRYNEDVPVLVHGERELSRHRLDTALVEGHLASCGRIR
jgi:thioredoxin reductase (NADPH)